MSTQTAKFNRPKVLAAVLALSAIAITLLAVVFATGPAQAQDNPPTPTPTPAPTTTPTPTPVLNTYADPQPCGPGAATAFQPEPHEVTTGHFALFDAYWRQTVRNQLENAGVLHTNLCPPKVVTTTQINSITLLPETVTTLTASGIDIDEAIFHVLDTHKVTVVATNAEATNGELSLEEYPRVRERLGLEKDDPVPAGTQVWWLQLDDPDTTGADEQSDLSLGFSTKRFDDEHWVGEDGESAFRYHFDLKRNPGIDPGEHPHVLTYRAPANGNAKQDPVWDSAEAGLGEMDMEPGRFENLQWIFTRPGTYEMSVHLLGSVRETNPHGRDHKEYDANWKRISDDKTETSEVKRYVIQVGDVLEEMEPPLFGLNVSVAENALEGVSVGDPIPVYRSEADALTYRLSGDGHENFRAVAATDPSNAAPHAVQIVVADGASLDYETKASYELTLSVTDNVDHENNADPTVDDVLAVRVTLEDLPPGLVLAADRPLLLPVGETVNFVAVYEPKPEHLGETFAYQWEEKIYEGGVAKWKLVGPSPSSSTWSVSQSSPGSKTYRVSVVMTLGDNPTPVFVHSNEALVIWEN